MQPIFGVHAYKNIQHSNPVKVPLWPEESFCEVAANLGSPDTMIVTEVGVGVACCATRRCSSGVEFAAASHDTRRFSVRGRALSTAPSGRRYASSGAGTCRRFPVRCRERQISD